MPANEIAALLKDLKPPIEAHRRRSMILPALSHHRDQISIVQPVGDVPAHAQLDDLAIEAAAAVNGVSDNWPRHLGIPWTLEVYDNAL